jgi:hypothetical protein
LLTSVAETLASRNDLQTDKGPCSLYITYNICIIKCSRQSNAPMKINAHSRPCFEDNVRNQHHGLCYDEYSLSNPYWFIGRTHPPPPPLQPTIISRSIPRTVSQSDCCICNGKLNEYSRGIKCLEAVIKISTTKYLVRRFTYVLLCYITYEQIIKKLPVGYLII